MEDFVVKDEDVLDDMLHIRLFLCILEIKG